MFEIFLAVGAFAFGVWLGWSAGVHHGEERILSAQAASATRSLTREPRSPAVEADDFPDHYQAQEKHHPNGERVLLPSARLAALIGPGPITATDACQRVLEYVEANGLRDGSSGVKCDAALQAALGVPTCTLFQITKLVRGELANAVS